jgi:hypothetical protein
MSLQAEREERRMQRLLNIKRLANEVKLVSGGVAVGLEGDTERLQAVVEKVRGVEPE